MPGAAHLRALRLLLAAMFFLVVGVTAYKFTQQTHAASSCSISSVLVNSCRPWLGAAVAGYPQVSSSKTAQFEYAEQRLGRKMDIFHDYHQPGNLPLSSDEKYFATRPNTYIYVNWKPASNWADAGGGNATVNASIDKAAASIKSVAPHKIFLTIWHEPENDVSGGTSCAIKPGTAGTPAQYRAMWQNVENRFKADGVTNVVWVMNYMNYPKWQCLVPELWPGNSLVDWVTFEAYDAQWKPGYPSFNNVVNDMYKTLEADNDSTHNFESKPWGIGEVGDCDSTNQSDVYTYYSQMKTALDNNTFPRLKMYMAYDDSGNNAGMGCLTEYSKAGNYDPTEQSYYNKFADDPIFTVDSSSTTPSGGKPGGTVSGDVSVDSNQATVIIDGKPVPVSDGTVNTTYLTNGEHTITTTKKNPNGTTSTITHTIDVQNDLATWQEVRDFLLSSLRGHPALMNGGFVVSLGIALVGVGFIAHHLLKQEPLYKTLQKTITRK